MTKRLCCCIPDQSKLDEGCSNPAEYEIYSSSPDGMRATSPETDSCAVHLELMLDDSVRFEILRIPKVDETPSMNSADEWRKSRDAK